MLLAYLGELPATTDLPQIPERTNPAGRSLPHRRGVAQSAFSVLALLGRVREEACLVLGCLGEHLGEPVALRAQLPGGQPALVQPDSGVQREDLRAVATNGLGELLVAVGQLNLGQV